MSKSIEGGWVITDHAITLTGYTKSFIHNLAEKKLIDAYDVGEDWLISKDSLLTYKAQQEKKEDSKNSSESS